MPIPNTTTKAEQDEELRRIGIHGDDGDNGDELNTKRRSSNARPKTIGDLDATAIYAKFNRRGHVADTQADDDNY